MTSILFPNQPAPFAVVDSEAREGVRQLTEEITDVLDIRKYDKTNLVDMVTLASAAESTDGTASNNIVWDAVNGYAICSTALGYHGGTYFAGQKLEVVEGETYTLSACVRIDNNENATHGVFFGFESQHPQSIIDDGVWVNIKSTVTIDAATVARNNGVARIILMPNKQSDIPLYIKDIVVVKGTTLPESTSKREIDSERLVGIEKRIEEIEDTTLRADINPNVKSVNHRGYGAAPENTLAAYRLSKEMGFDIVECDVSMTADGVPVLLHDSTIDRTSNGSGNISELTLAEVQKFDFGSWKSSDYKGEKIPTFEEFILLCRSIGLHPYIEVKSSGFTQEQIVGLVKTVEKLGMKGKVTWISFALSSLQNIAAVDNAARLGYVVGAVQSEHVTSAKELKTDANEVFIDACYTELTESQIELCYNEGIPLEVWGIGTANSVLTCNPYVSGFTMDTVVAGVELYKYAISQKSTIIQNDYIFLNGVAHAGNGLSVNTVRSMIVTTTENGSPEIPVVDDKLAGYVTEPVYLIAIPDGATTVKVTCPNLKWAYRGTTVTNSWKYENDSGWLTDGSTYTMPVDDVRCMLVFGRVDNEKFDRSIDYMKDITVTFN